MLTLNDGRAELWQWDTGRTLAVDADCSQVHFSNKVFGRSIDVDVVDGVAIIPDILLQTDKDLNVWAFVGTAENGYTKISKTFKVNRRNKPADYVFTPVEQTTIAEIAAIAQSVRDDADAGRFDGAKGPAGEDGGYYTPAVTQPDANTIRMSFTPSKEGMPAVADTDITLPAGGNGLTTAQVKALDGMFKVAAYIKADVSKEYNAFRTAFDIEAATITGISATYSGGNVTAGTSVDELTGIVVTANYSDGSKQTVTGYTLSGTIEEGSNTITVTYEGMTTTFTVTGVAEEVTLTSISATYSGGDVAVGTAVTDLTGIVVTANYSDGSQQNVTGYTLSGTIAEGENSVTVTYQGMTTTFSVNGVAESSGGWEEQLTIVRATSVTPSKSNGFTITTTTNTGYVNAAIADSSVHSGGVLYVDMQDRAFTFEMKIVLEDSNGTRFGMANTTTNGNNVTSSNEIINMNVADNDGVFIVNTTVGYPFRVPIPDGYHVLAFFRKISNTNDFIAGNGIKFTLKDV